MKPYLSKEPRNKVSENDCLVRLIVTRRGRDARAVPQICFPLIHILICCLRVDQQHTGGAFNQPSSVEDTNATAAHSLDTLGKLLVDRFQLLDLDRSLYFLHVRYKHFER